MAAIVGVNSRCGLRIDKTIRIGHTEQYDAFCRKLIGAIRHKIWLFLTRM